MRNKSDEEILEYLMTSDFNDNLSPDDLKFLLQKFRHFYRILGGKSNSMEIERKKYASDLENLKFTKDNEIQLINSQKFQLIDDLKLLLHRKLTFKERFFGKLLVEKKFTNL